MPLILAKSVGVVKAIGTLYRRGVDKDELRARARATRRATARRDLAHETLVDAIWEAADEGMQQVDIVAAVGLTRERVRQLCDPGYRDKALKRRAQADQ